MTKIKKSKSVVYKDTDEQNSIKSVQFTEVEFQNEFNELDALKSENNALKQAKGKKSYINKDLIKGMDSKHYNEFKRGFKPKFFCSNYEEILRNVPSEFYKTDFHNMQFSAMGVDKFVNFIDEYFKAPESLYFCVTSYIPYKNNMSDFTKQTAINSQTALNIVFCYRARLAIKFNNKSEATVLIKQSVYLLNDSFTKLSMYTKQVQQAVEFLKKLVSQD